MIAAGKASGTTIDTSRTTCGCRGSSDDALLAVLEARHARQRQLRDEDAVSFRRASAIRDDRGEEPDQTDRTDRIDRGIAARVGRGGAASRDEPEPRGLPRNQEPGSGRLEPELCAERGRHALEHARHVEEVHLAAGVRPVGWSRGSRPRQPDRAFFAAVRVNLAPISKSATSRRPCRRLCATASTSPGSSDGRSVSN